MFSLIISLVTVALVVTLSLASMFYLGGATSKATDEVVATRLINETSQIKSATLLFNSDNNRLPISLEELAENKKYLSEIPAGWGNGAAEFNLNNPSVTESTCLAFNKKLSINLVPACSDELYKNVLVCCRSD